MNTVTIIGHIANDPELRNTNSGKTVCNFTLAVPRPGKDTQPDYIDITVWEKTADIIMQYAPKGKHVGITGRLRQEKWETESGKRSKIVVVGNEIQLL